MLQILENKDQLRHLYAKMLKDPSKELKMKAVACFSEVRDHLLEEFKLLKSHNMIGL